MILLIGTGPMAVQYAKILNALGKKYQVVGRGVDSAQRFEHQSGKNFVAGGLTEYVQQYGLKDISHAIVVVNLDQLYSCAETLLVNGVGKVLLEKPACLTSRQALHLKQLAEDNQASVFVAYNRRFLASVYQLKQFIEDDGGVVSFNFDVTERGKLIETLNKPDDVLHNWFLANTTHVVDLAFHLGGYPQQLSTFISGELEWHNGAAAFNGSGISQLGASFSYTGNWAVPGNWGVQICTKNFKYLLSPLEKLKRQANGETEIKEVEIDDDLDQKYKPGLYKQLTSFLSSSSCEVLCSIQEHADIFSTYEKMAGYNS